MRSIFHLMLAISAVALVGGCCQSLGVMAHAHNGDRIRTLQGLQKPVFVGDHRNSYFGLTRDELSKYGEPLAHAYEASVGEASRLGAGYGTLYMEYNILATLLFVASLLGLRTLDARACSVPSK